MIRVLFATILTLVSSSAFAQFGQAVGPISPCSIFGTASGTCLQGAGALGSPLSIGTLPAFTLGGAISGGGNQINNVVIGFSTPLAITGTTINATGASGYQLNAAAVLNLVATNFTALSDPAGTAKLFLGNATASDANTYLGTTHTLANATNSGNFLVVNSTKATFSVLIAPTSGATLTCGSGCSSVTGNPQKMTVTTGTAQTSIAVNFGITWSAAPVCTVSSNSTASVVDIASISTTVITFGASVALTGANLNVLCF